MRIFCLLVYVFLSAYSGNQWDFHIPLNFWLQDEEFVVLLERGVVPRTHNVRGSNYCLMNVFPDRITGRAIIISVVCLHSCISMLKFLHFCYNYYPRDHHRLSP